MTTTSFADFDPTLAFSAKQASGFAAAAKTAAQRKAIRAYVDERKTRNPRWANLLADIDAGNGAKLLARATGDWAEVNASRKAAKAAAKPKAPAKAKAAKATPAKAAKQPKPDVAGDPMAKAIAEAKRAGMDAQMAARFAAAWIAAQ